MILNCGSAIKEISEDFSVVSLSGSSGQMQSNVSGIQRNVTVSEKGTCDNCNFKDINLGAAFMVNAKNGCSNLGNNIGFVFNDFVE